MRRENSVLDIITSIESIKQAMARIIALDNEQGRRCRSCRASDLNEQLVAQETNITESVVIVDYMSHWVIRVHNRM